MLRALAIPYHALLDAEDDRSFWGALGVLQALALASGRDGQSAFHRALGFVVFQRRFANLVWLLPGQKSLVLGQIHLPPLVKEASSIPYGNSTKFRHPATPRQEVMTRQTPVSLWASDTLSVVRGLRQCEFSVDGDIVLMLVRLLPVTAR
jgi:hypothetical protein